MSKSLKFQICPNNLRTKNWSFPVICSSFASGKVLTYFVWKKERYSFLPKSREDSHSFLAKLKHFQFRQNFKVTKLKISCVTWISPDISNLRISFDPWMDSVDIQFVMIVAQPYFEQLVKVSHSFVTAFALKLKPLQHKHPVYVVPSERNFAFWTHFLSVEVGEKVIWRFLSEICREFIGIAQQW
jgi:hypothetical protein